MHPMSQDEFKENDALIELRAAHNRVLRQLNKAQLSRDEMAEAVYRAAKDAAASMHIPQVAAPKADKRKKQDETAVLILGDWQLGKITPTYNSDIAAARIDLLAEKVLKLVEIQRADHPVRHLRILCVGDLVEGEDIFPGQQHLIDAGLYGQLFRGGEILANLVRKMSAAFESVRVISVIGNHGRLSRRGVFRPESNADAMMIRIAKMAAGDDKRVQWVEPFTQGERHWYATEEIQGQQWFLFHGDQVGGGFAGFPWYGFGKKLLAWQLSVAPFRYSVSGHFHTPVRMYLNGITHWGSGSTESGNTYAAETLAASGEPSQWLIFAHPEGISAEYLVRLDGKS